MSDRTNYVVIDIETVAGENSPQYYASKKYTAPSNYKDPAKIEAYVLERKHEDQRQAALSWWTGKIICVSVRSVKNAFPPVTIRGNDEREMLLKLFALLEGQSSIALIGKSADVFDKPYLIGRAMALKIGIPRCLRPYRIVEDVDQIFGFSAAAGQRGSLADYAFGLGLGGKLGSGGDVQTWYHETQLGDDGGWDKIAEYCARDVDITHELLARWLVDFAPLTGVPHQPPSQPQPKEEIDMIPF